MPDVMVFETIAALKASTSIPSNVDAVFVEAYARDPVVGGGDPRSTRGGGLLQRVPGGTSSGLIDDGVLVFEGEDAFWIRNLDGGVVDAYMAGALGGARISDSGGITPGSHDDSAAINRLFNVVFNYNNPRANSLELRFAIGDGTFYVAQPLWLQNYVNAPRGWVIDCTGATILGACPDKPVIDLTDRRFGTLLNAQVIGLVGPDGRAICSCGVRVGRNADNNAANQITMDHAGIRGNFKLAAMLNVAAEQFAALNCEFANEEPGDTYGYAADAYNCLQWMRPIAIATIRTSLGTTTVTTVTNHDLAPGDIIIVKGQAPSASVFDTKILPVMQPVGSKTFTISDTDLSGNFDGGNVYRRLYGGAIDTPDLTPWQPASFKEQYHRQGNYRAPRGTAAMLETCDSQHVFEAMHPTCSFYPEATTAGAPAAKAVISSVVKSSATDPRTIVKIVTPPATPFSDNQLVSVYGVTGAVAGDINGRLFIVAGAGLVAGQFELRDIDGSPIESSGWDLGDAGYGASTVVRQKVADGDDPYAGGFGMRMIVGADAGCDVSRYLMHHEAGTASATDPVTGAVFNGETMWWASIESFEGWLNAGVTGFTPPPVTFSDVTFAELAAHGRGGFLLARRERTTGVTMLGGRIALTQAARGFGNTGPVDKLLTATGTGPNLWSLANTDLVLDKAALVNVTGLAGFSGRLTAGTWRSASASPRSIRGRSPRCRRWQGVRPPRWRSRRAATTRCSARWTRPGCSPSSMRSMSAPPGTRRRRG